MFKRLIPLVVLIILIILSCVPSPIPAPITVTVPVYETKVETIIKTENITIPCPACPKIGPVKQTELRFFNNLAELREFLAQDKTNEMKAVLGQFMCFEFAEALIKNANAKGFKMYWYPCKDSASNQKDHLRCITVVLNECDDASEWTSNNTSCKPHKIERQGRVYGIEADSDMILKYDVID